MEIEGLYVCLYLSAFVSLCLAAAGGAKKAAVINRFFALGSDCFKS